jgi:hypothetical protein
MLPTVIPAQISHGLELAQRLRKEDMQEIEAFFGIDPRDAHLPLIESIRASDFARTIMYDGAPQAIYGVAAPGQAWLVSSGRQKEFRRFAREQTFKGIQEMHQYYPRLYNWVDDRNVESIRWLKWCGFKPTDTGLFNGIPFTKFERT